MSVQHALLIRQAEGFRVPDDASSSGEKFKRLSEGIASFFKLRYGIPEDKNSHLSYFVIFLFLLIAPFFINSSGEASDGLTIFGLPLPLACPSRSIFNVECPGCGLTRSFAALTQGKVALAFQIHHVGPLLYLFFVFRAIFHFQLLRHPENASQPALNRLYDYSAWVMLGLLLIGWFFKIL
jgi:hypothetical protein